MSERIIFDYFKGQESDMLSFYRIPKLLFTNDYFKQLCVEAKVLYGLMLDRMSLSLKNKWFDAENRAYIYFSQQDAMEMLNCKENKIGALFKDLEQFQLIERKKQGQGKPTIIYLKNFVQEENICQTFEKTMSKEDENKSNNDKVSDMGKTNVKTLEKSMSRPLKNPSPDMGKTNANYNNINNTDLNKYHIDQIDQTLNAEYLAYAERIRENLELSLMKIRYPHYAEVIDGIYDLIIETVINKNDIIWISKNKYPGELVRSKFLKLNSSHIEYVLECMKQSTTKIRNIKSYLLSALFNAPTTIGSYYQAEANYDMKVNLCYH
ncbi:DUF6017 domain-containing protein [Oribacterium sp. P6A1]|uniref:DUF6017 domain-containing protein n=1 Tax=Oribacterium sp. P6A1 TaxID=1410612 RepID=UPI0005638972|nr:DUF6017 domain-containing protein [Oribacterium sp. P6A1]